MKNKLTDLNDHLFEALERLNDEDLKPEDIEKESKRAEAIVSVADRIMNNAKITIEALKVMNDRDIILPDTFGIKQLK